MFQLVEDCGENPLISITLAGNLTHLPMPAGCGFFRDIDRTICRAGLPKSALCTGVAASG